MVAAVALVIAGGTTSAGTFRASKNSNTRKLLIVREYSIPAVKGKPCTAAIPAMMTVWGATNQQVILEDRFTYAVKPDRIQITADNRGMWRRNYELSWDEAPAAKIAVKQTLVVELRCRTTLATAATIPYPKDVADRFAKSLRSDEHINMDNPKLAPIVKAITGRTRNAEGAVELVCDWVNDNITFRLGSPRESDKALASGKSSCTGMSNLACALLRRMGVPAEPVSGTFVSGGGHAFMEAYFPDCGWVFYDLSNATRGYKSLDCLLTTGYSFRVKTPSGERWHEGKFLKCKDLTPFRELVAKSPALRRTPKQNVIGVRVLRRKPAASVRARHQSISALIADLKTSPGRREYRQAAPARLGDPSSRPATPGAKTPGPAGDPEAAGKLALGRAYLKAGLTAKARALFQGIVKNHPGTPEAKVAQAELSKLGPAR